MSEGVTHFQMTIKEDVPHDPNWSEKFLEMLAFQGRSVKCPQCQGKCMVTLPSIGDLVHRMQSCPTCNGKGHITTAEAAAYDEAQGDLRERVRELERRVAELVERKEYE